jgi:hypothetical protein
MTKAEHGGGRKVQRRTEYSRVRGAKGSKSKERGKNRGSVRKERERGDMKKGRHEKEKGERGQ